MDREIKSNALEILFPKGVVASPPTDVILSIPVRIGIALPPEKPSSWDDNFTEDRKQVLLERIAAAFGVDLVALISYDQHHEAFRAATDDLIVNLNAALDLFKDQAQAGTACGAGTPAVAVVDATTGDSITQGSGSARTWCSWSRSTGRTTSATSGPAAMGCRCRWPWRVSRTTSTAARCARCSRRPRSSSSRRRRTDGRTSPDLRHRPARRHHVQRDRQRRNLDPSIPGRYAGAV